MKRTFPAVTICLSMTLTLFTQTGFAQQQRLAISSKMSLNETLAKKQNATATATERKNLVAEKTMASGNKVSAAKSNNEKLIIQAEQPQRKSAIGGSGTGGGGGICVSDKCITLAEAGLTIANSNDEGNIQAVKTPGLSRETYQKYSELQAQAEKTFYPFMSMKLKPEEAVRDFVPVSVIDEHKFNEIREQYKQLLESLNFSTENFELLAVSDKDKTYLLPAFYKANTQSQALTVFHEILMRGYYKNPQNISSTNALRMILSFDIGLIKVLRNDLSAIFDVTKAMYKFSSASALSVVLAKVLSVTNEGQYIHFSETVFKLLGREQTLPKYDKNPTYESIDFWNLFNAEQPELAKIFDAVDLKDAGLYKYNEYFQYSYLKSFQPDRYIGTSELKVVEGICKSADGYLLTFNNELGSGAYPVVVTCKDGKFISIATLKVNENVREIKY